MLEKYLLLAVTLGMISADAQTWTQSFPQPPTPTARQSAVMAYDAVRKQVVLFGGFEYTSPNATWGNDTWVWDGATWTQQFPQNSPPPNNGQRYPVLATNVNGDGVILVEVNTYPGYYCYWLWNGVNWTGPTALPVPLAYRYAAAMTYDSAQNEVVLFGGVGCQLGFQLYPDCISLPNENDTWVWDGNIWTQKAPPLSPTPRNSSMMAYDSARQQVLLFGGQSSNGLLNDTWTWDGNTWTERFPQNSPYSRTYAAISSDDIRSEVLLYGGLNNSLPNPFLVDTWTWDGSHWTQQNVDTPYALYPAMTYDINHKQIVDLAFGNTWLWDQTSSAGTIIVTTNLSTAAFTITGPTTYSGSNLSFTQINVPPGTYTVTYSSINCYLTPAPETKTLVAGEILSFTGGTYLPNATATVIVTPTAATSATFSITPPIVGMRTTGPYPIMQTGIIPQAYTITFNQIDGFTPPQQQTSSADSSCHINFSGAYTVPTGPTAMLEVSTNEPLANRPTFTVLDSTGTPLPNATNISFFPLSPVPAGAYSVRYNVFPGYYTPVAQKVTLNPGGSVALQGLYRRLILVSFTGFNDAPTPSDCIESVLLNAGSGIEYLPNVWNAVSARGMTTLLYNIQQNDPSLAQGAHMAAFTYYSTDGFGNQLGNACIPTSSTDADHYEATRWVLSVFPTADDIMVIMGHSYGGNRTRLFAQELQQKYNLQPALLITVDPIDWDVASIETVINQVFQGIPGTPLVNQSGLTYASWARASLSFRQIQGQPIPGVPPSLAVIGVEGYSLAGVTAIIEPDYHIPISSDPSVQNAITSTLAKMVGPPQVVTAPGTGSRVDGEISVPVKVSVSGSGTATGIALTAASLNGVAASYLGGSLGDVAAGSSTTAVVTFPAAAAAAGSRACGGTCRARN